MEDKDKSNDHMSRREVLRAGGMTGALLVGTAAGMASASRAEAKGLTHPHDVADDEELRAYEDYADDPALVKRTFEDQVDPVRQMLASEGISVPGSLDEATEFEVVPGRIDGDASAHIIAQFEHEVTVHVYPHAERAFARVPTSETFDDGRVETKEFDSDDGVTIQACYKECVPSPGQGICPVLHGDTYYVYNCCTFPGSECGTCCTYEGAICSFTGCN
jgi:hypothetical protein